MTTQRRTSRRAGPKKAGGASSRLGNATNQAIILALREVDEPPQPRTRMRLRAVMRKIGLDEWKIAWLLNFKIHCLAQSTKSSDTKLLLDYLKEAARHLDAASPRAGTEETAAIEVVHNVPRPDRSEAHEQ